MEEKLPDNLLKIIENGEGIAIEFKEAKKKLPDSLFESVCSMLNRNGGHIFLGLNDNGDAIGVYKDYIKDRKKTLHLNVIIQKNYSQQLI